MTVWSLVRWRDASRGDMGELTSLHLRYVECHFKTHLFLCQSSPLACFLPRVTVLSTVYAVVVCLSVCVCVCHSPVLYPNG